MQKNAWPSGYWLCHLDIGTDSNHRLYYAWIIGTMSALRKLPGDIVPSLRAGLRLQATEATERKLSSDI